MILIKILYIAIKIDGFFLFLKINDLSFYDIELKGYKFMKFITPLRKFIPPKVELKGEIVYTMTGMFQFSGIASRIMDDDIFP